MIIQSSAPCRISLLGGGSDIEPFASKHGGVVVNFSINLYQHITLYTGEDARGETHSFPENANPEFLLTIAKLLKEPFVIQSVSDAQLGSGLGSSAAAATALLTAIFKSQHKTCSKEDIAQGAYLAELDMGWYGGRQDQFASTFGGWNVIEFGKGTPVVNSLARGFVEPLQDSLVLFYMGKRTVKSPQEQFRELTKKQTDALLKMKEIAVGSLDYIGKADYEKLGGLLDLAWKEKKKSNTNVSNPQIDTIYTQALQAGAFGGKVCGAGSGGYMFFIVDPKQRQEFLEKMKKTGLEEVDFSFEWNGAQARIL